MSLYTNSMVLTSKCIYAVKTYKCGICTWWPCTVIDLDLVVWLRGNNVDISCNNHSLIICKWRRCRMPVINSSSPSLYDFASWTCYSMKTKTRLTWRTTRPATNGFSWVTRPSSTRFTIRAARNRSLIWPLPSRSNAWRCSTTSPLSCPVCSCPSSLSSFSGCRRKTRPRWFWVRRLKEAG